MQRGAMQRGAMQRGAMQRGAMQGAMQRGAMQRGAMQRGAMQSGSMLVKRKGRKMMNAILEGCTFMTPKRTKKVLLIINNTLLTTR